MRQFGPSDPLKAPVSLKKSLTEDKIKPKRRLTGFPELTETNSDHCGSNGLPGGLTKNLLRFCTGLREGVKSDHRGSIGQQIITGVPKAFSRLTKNY